MEKLRMIVKELKAPKKRLNTFGGFSYRSCEDILEAVKPLLDKYGVNLHLTDEPLVVGTYQYIKSTATLTDGNETVTATAVAREPESKKGMDASQLTGATSSYARKYALNGLFLIDDAQDPDQQKPTTENKDDPARPAEVEQIVAIEQYRDNTFSGNPKAVAWLDKHLSRDLTYKEAQEVLSHCKLREGQKK